MDLRLQRAATRILRFAFRIADSGHRSYPIDFEGWAVARGKRWS